MIRAFFVCAALAVGLFDGAATASAAVEAPTVFRAPGVPAPLIARLGPMMSKAGIEEDARGRLKVGSVRALPKAAAVPEWLRVDGAYLTRFSASSSGAEGLRVRLDFGTLPGAVEVRVRGSDSRVESMVADPLNGPEAWTPWTEGDTQEVEIVSAVLPSASAVRVGAVVHFTASPVAKAAGTCTVPTSCSTNNAALDAAMAQAKKSIMKINFIEDGSGFICSATLIDTERAPVPYVLTANHCIDNSVTANSVSSLWFYETLDCGGGIVNPGMKQIAGGTQLVMGNLNVDSTLLLMNSAPPAGAVYSPWTREHLASDASVLSLSHPQGDTSRFALGAISREFRVTDRPQDFYGVRFTRGIIQGGSSGSGLFVLGADSRLRLAGILSGTTIRHAGGMSCTNLDEDALYSRFDIFELQMDQYIRASAQAPDDAPNRPQDLFGTAVGASPTDSVPLDTRSATLAVDNRRIDYAGDLDVFRFTLTAPSIVSAWTEGANLDTVGSILDSRGVALETNDDAQAGDNHFGITRQLAAGTYYVQVGHWEPAGTGAYNLRLRAEPDQVNYTDLWSNPAENGWGLNLNHQGNKLFGAVFTYDASGAPMWLVMSEGVRQGDGAFQGTLYRGSGPAFNAVPWRAASLSPVGTMRIAFSGRDNGTLTYTYNGTQVTKSISRFVYSTKPSCGWSMFDRTYADNFQDLWWKPGEDGWGVNVSHQGDTLFASLYTYDQNGRDLWLVMSDGRKTGTGQYSGTLYRTSGPPFDTAAWRDAAPVAVGTMSFAFTSGNAGTLTYTYNGTAVTKQIERFVFAPMKTQCES
jgi:hypothetical protein